MNNIFSALPVAFGGVLGSKRRIGSRYSYPPVSGTLKLKG